MNNNKLHSYFNNANEHQRFSLRKLNIGLASVLLGVSFVVVNQQQQVVKAAVAPQPGQAANNSTSQEQQAPQHQEIKVQYQATSAAAKAQQANEASANASANIAKAAQAPQAAAKSAADQQVKQDAQASKPADEKAAQPAAKTPAQPAQPTVKTPAKQTLQVEKLSKNATSAQDVADSKASSSSNGNLLQPKVDESTAATPAPVKDPKANTNQQQIYINYKDADNNVVSHVALTGKTGDTANINLSLPDGWVLNDPKESIPKTYTFKANDNKDIDVVIKHGEITITKPVKKGDWIPNTKGQKFQQDITDDDLETNSTRTIHFHWPKKVIDAMRGNTPAADFGMDILEGKVPQFSGMRALKDYPSDPERFDAIELPQLSGYTPEYQRDPVTNLMMLCYVPDNKTTSNTPSFGTVTFQVPKVTDPNIKQNKDGSYGTKYEVIKKDPNDDYTTDFVQTIYWHRNAIVDTVTGTAKLSDWISNPSSFYAKSTNLNDSKAQAPSATKPTSPQDPSGSQKSGTTSSDTGETGDHDVDVDGDGDIPDITIGHGYHGSGTIGYDANDQQININYKSAIDGSIVKQDLLKGKTKEAKDVTVSLPDGWVLNDPNQAIPKSYTFQAENNKDIDIIIKHGIATVTHDKPVNKDDPIPGTSSKKFPAGLTATDLNRDIKRTITVVDPHTGSTSTVQEVKLYRDATVDEVDGTIKYGDWTADGNSKFAAFTAPTVAGYTPSQATVAEVTPTADTKDSEVRITYTANPQTMTYKFWDDTENTEIGSDHTLSGVTDQQVNTGLTAPAGYDLVSGSIPTSYTFKASGNDPVTIHFKHHLITVKPGDLPNKDSKKPGDGDGNKKPGDGNPTHDLNYDSVHRDMTRVVTIGDAGAAKGSTDTETINYERTATIDDVTGNVTYTDWTPVKGSADNFKEVDAPAVDGYTPDKDKVNASKLTQDDITNWKGDEHDSINYTANASSFNVHYVDGDGNKVNDGKDDQNFTGKTDQAVTGKINLPAGWVTADGSTPTLPTNYVPQDKEQDITITLKHGTFTIKPGDVPNKGDKKPGDNGSKVPGDKKPINDVTYDDLHRNMERDVIIGDAGATKGSDHDEMLKYERIATVDDVTGKVTYSDWTPVTGSNKNFSEVDVPAVDGYKPDKDKVDASNFSQDDITNWKGKQTIKINYTANGSSFTVHYVDAKGNKVNSGSDDQTFTGKTDDKVTTDTNGKGITIPAGWETADGKDVTLPTNYVPSDKEQDITVTLKHHMITVKPGEIPTKDGKKQGDNGHKKPGDGNPTNDISYNDLHRDMDRKVTIGDAGATKGSVDDETIHYERTATIDDVTGDVTYSKWTVSQNSAAGFNKVTVPKVDGYASSQDPAGDNIGAYVPTQDQIQNWKDQDIHINYTANASSFNVHYVDAQGNKVNDGKDDQNFTGKTDQAVTGKINLPAGWVTADGSTPTLPAKYVPSDQEKDITITLKHGTFTVKPGDVPTKGGKFPGDNGNKVPGDKKPKNDIAYSELHRDMTRTVIIGDAGAHKGSTDTETLHYERTATVDDVTGEVLGYSDWTVSTGSSQGFNNVNVPTYAGYTSSQDPTDGNIGAYVPTQDQITNWKDQNINIAYKANSQTTHVIYKDEQGNVQHTTTVTGDTDQTVTVPNELPDGWVQSDPNNQHIPTSITFGGTPTADTIITIKHGTITVDDKHQVKKGDKIIGTKTKTYAQDIGSDELDDNSTRKIVFIFPDGYTVPDYLKQDMTDPTHNTILQEVDWNRIATVDTVTGQVISYTDYTPVAGSGHDWYQDASGLVHFKSIKVPKIPGYTIKVTHPTANTLMLQLFAVKLPTRPATGPDMSENKTQSGQGSSVKPSGDSNKQTSVVNNGKPADSQTAKTVDNSKSAANNNSNVQAANNNSQSANNNNAKVANNNNSQVVANNDVETAANNNSAVSASGIKETDNSYIIPDETVAKPSDNNAANTSANNAADNTNKPAENNASAKPAKKNTKVAKNSAKTSVKKTANAAPAIKNAAKSAVKPTVKVAKSANAASAPAKKSANAVAPEALGFNQPNGSVAATKAAKSAPVSEQQPAAQGAGQSELPQTGAKQKANGIFAGIAALIASIGLLGASKRRKHEN